jgi:RND family efflux transporter MFP subunit
MKAIDLFPSALLLAAVLPACGPATPAEPEGGELPAIAVTVWSERTELFMEHPPLVEGEPARFAIHLTDLSTFAPIREGRVVVRFEGESIERFEVDGPSSPGIFGVDVTPPKARRYQLAVELHGEGLSDEHRVGAVTVHPDAEAALASMGGGDGEGASSFLKEQQWTLDFRTTVVDSHPRRAVVSVPAVIEPRVGGSVEIQAPANGRIAAGGGRAIGTRVGRGDALVELIARNERLGEGPILKLELSIAEAELRLARADLARVERLASAGAVPERRRVEARVEEETAAARVKIAEEQVRHLELSRSGQGTGNPGERVEVRTPLSGVVAEARATPGATVREGELLFRVVALDRVHVVGTVPEQHLARIQDVSGAEIEVPGLSAPLRATRLVSIGRVVDPGTRAVPVIFELESPPPAVAVGQAVALRLITVAESDEIAVPRDAIVDDGGQPIVFVQTGGESFERRPVTVGGAREGGFVRIEAGLDPGERVVVRGAHLVRLAALSPQTPGHGHVH